MSDLNSDPNTYNDCINIIEDKNKLNHTELLNKWETFRTKYPKLYEMLTITETIDLNLLKFLCDSAEKQKLLNKEEQLENEFKVGETLAKKYIYDKFQEPTVQQTEFIKNSLRKKLLSNESNIQ